VPPNLIIREKTRTIEPQNDVAVKFAKDSPFGHFIEAIALSPCCWPTQDFHQNRQTEEREKSVKIALFFSRETRPVSNVSVNKSSNSGKKNSEDRVRVLLIHKRDPQTVICIDTYQKTLQVVARIHMVSSRIDTRHA
jgi:hypothetical protein